MKIFIIAGDNGEGFTEPDELEKDFGSLILELGPIVDEIRGGGSVNEIANRNGISPVYLSRKIINMLGRDGYKNLLAESYKKRDYVINNISKTDLENMINEIRGGATITDIAAKERGMSDGYLGQIIERAIGEDEYKRLLEESFANRDIISFEKATKIINDNISLIIGRIGGGYSVKEVSYEFGISFPNFQSILKKLLGGTKYNKLVKDSFKSRHTIDSLYILNHPEKKQKIEEREALKDRIVGIFKERKNISEIAREVGVSNDYVMEALRERLSVNKMAKILGEIKAKMALERERASLSRQQKGENIPPRKNQPYVFNGAKRPSLVESVWKLYFVQHVNSEDIALKLNIPEEKIKDVIHSIRGG